MEKDDKILLTGHTGLLGKAIAKSFDEKGFKNIIKVSSNDLDLMNQEKVNDFFFKNRPKNDDHAAAKAGGILANKSCPADFIFNNLVMQNNVFKSTLDIGVKKLLFISSTCAYPKNVSQPMKESDILSGPFTDEVEPYSLSKVCGMRMLEAFHDQYNFQSNSVMLPNLYGPGDHYGDLSNHVIPALIERFVLAKKNREKSVEVWGSGNAIREFLYIDDAAGGIIFLLKNHNSVKPINLSSRESISISDLAYLIKEIVNYSGEVVFNASRPEGAPVKISDTELIDKLGWNPKINLRAGLKMSIDDYKRRFTK